MGKKAPSIDTRYLQEIVARSGLSQSEFGPTVGRRNGYVHSCMKRGVMTRDTAKLICRMYGAELDRLIPPEDSHRETVEVDLDELVQILTAVLQHVTSMEKKINKLYEALM